MFDNTLQTENEKAYIKNNLSYGNNILKWAFRAIALMAIAWLAFSILILLKDFSILGLIIGTTIFMEGIFGLLLYIISRAIRKEPKWQKNIFFQGVFHIRKPVGRYSTERYFIDSQSVLIPNHWLKLGYLSEGRKYICKAYPLGNKTNLDKLYYGPDGPQLLLELKNGASIDSEYHLVKKIKPQTSIVSTTLVGTLLFIAIIINSTTHLTSTAINYIQHSKSKVHEYNSIQTLSDSDLVVGKEVAIDSALVMKGLPGIILPLEDNQFLDTINDLSATFHERAVAISYLEDININTKDNIFEKSSILSNLDSYSGLNELQLLIEEKQQISESLLSREDDFEVTFGLIALMSLLKDEVLEKIASEEALYLHKLIRTKMEEFDADVKYVIEYSYDNSLISEYDVRNGEAFNVLKNEYYNSYFSTQNIQGIIVATEPFILIDTNKRYKPGLLYSFNIFLLGFVVIFIVLLYRTINGIKRNNKIIESIKKLY